MDKNKFNTHVYFSLVGENFNPDKISQKLAINPTESWQTGDKGKYKKELTFSCWKLSTDKGKEYHDIDKLVIEMPNVSYTYPLAII